MARSVLRKWIINAAAGSMAFLSIAASLGCSSEDDLSNANPTYNPETGEVSVDFVYNVSTANEPQTRMTAANTQATNQDAFRGITDGYLATFKLPLDGKSVSSAVNATRNYSFGTMLAAGALKRNGGSGTGSRCVIELSIGTGVNALAFWGKAIKTGTDQEQGRVEMTIDKDLANTSFSLCRIVPEEADATAPDIYQTAFQQYQRMMATVLTKIMMSGINKVTYNNTTRNVTLFFGDYAEISGSAGNYELNVRTDEPYGNTQIGDLGERLSTVFVKLNAIRDNELRDGSGQAISFMVAELMSVINSVIEARTVSLQDAIAQAVAVEVKKNVEKSFDPTTGYQWRSVDAIKQNFDISGIELVKSSSDLNKFPTDFNLPVGSALLQLAIERKDAADAGKGYNFTYSYKPSLANYSVGGVSTPINFFDPKSYMYPAELCYFGNSPIRVSDETLVETDYPDGAAKWETESSWKSNGWSTADKHVLSSTRSVAMGSNINYGTALLKTQVRYGAATLYDNNKKLQKQWNDFDAPDNEIDVAQEDNLFLLTGVLISGQEQVVGWNYIAKSGSPTFGSVVYDKVDNIPVPRATNSTSATSGTLSKENYTLLWDNWEQARYDNQMKQRDVYIALEFKNKGKDFYGESNLVRNEGTFYLIGKLDPAAGRSTIEWPTKYALPPYDADGNTIQESRVFIQDYMTTATFVIGETSLQHALVTVPDLNSGQTSLGLSVDVEWKTGLDFKKNIILGE